MTENWRPVVGFEGLYEVSDLGRVFSSRRGKVLKSQAFPNGYLCVHLDGGNCRLVHRLVAAAFVDGASEDLQVNHKNGIRADNRATNLEWVTCSENHKHSYRELHRKRHAWATPVVGFSLRSDDVLMLQHGSEAEHFGMDKVEVLRAVSGGRRGTHCAFGYAWFKQDSLDVSYAERVLAANVKRYATNGRDPSTGRILEFSL